MIYTRQKAKKNDSVVLIFRIMDRDEKKAQECNQSMGHKHDSSPL